MKIRKLLFYFSIQLKAAVTATYSLHKELLFYKCPLIPRQTILVNKH